MEKNVSLKYWREFVSTIVYTLIWVQIKKGTHSTPFGLWYGSKCCILKDVMNGKLDAKSEEGIFLGYSTRSKAYKCLNTNINKIVESINVNFDEYIEFHDVEPIKKI